MSEYYAFPENPDKLIRECLSVATNSRTDQLDRHVSFARQPTDKTVEEVLEMSLENRGVIWSFIRRSGWLTDGPDYWEVGSRVTDLKTKIDYFLWVELDLGVGKGIIEKYQLEQRK